MEKGREEEVREMKSPTQLGLNTECQIIGCVGKPTITIDGMDFCTQHTPIHCKECKSADSVVFVNTQKMKDPESRDVIISTKWFCKLCRGSFRTERRIGDLERFPRSRRRRR